MTIERFNVLGVGVSALNLDTARDAVLEALAERRKGFVCLANVYGVVEAQNDPALRGIYNEAFLSTTDGMPLVWLGRLRAGGHVGRVYGPDLMREVFEATRDGRFTHFFYGGTPGVAEELKEKMEARFPGARVAGTYGPPFRPLNEQEAADLAARLRELKPDILWVGISSPKQERFMAEYLAKLDVTLMFGVGAAFDFFSGRVRQAPRWIQRSGFEWLYRFCTEPRRLFRRYMVSNPLFLAHTALQLSGLRKYPIEEKPRGE